MASEIVINPKFSGGGLEVQRETMLDGIVVVQFPLITYETIAEFGRPVFRQVEGDAWRQSYVKETEIEDLDVGEEVDK